MHVNKTFFFMFLEGGILLNCFFKISKKKPGIFNIGSVSYSISLQPNIW